MWIMHVCLVIWSCLSEKTENTQKNSNKIRRIQVSNTAEKRVITLKLIEIKFIINMMWKCKSA